MINRIREFYEESTGTRPPSTDPAAPTATPAERRVLTRFEALMLRNPGTVLVVAFTLGTVLGWWLKRK